MVLSVCASVRPSDLTYIRWIHHVLRMYACMYLYNWVIFLYSSCKSLSLYCLLFLYVTNITTVLEMWPATFIGKTFRYLFWPIGQLHLKWSIRYNNRTYNKKGHYDTTVFPPKFSRWDFPMNVFTVYTLCFNDRARNCTKFCNNIILYWSGICDKNWFQGSEI